jgi:hypothetical protein
MDYRLKNAYGNIYNKDIPVNVMRAERLGEVCQSVLNGVFLSEAVLGGSTTVTSLPGYYDKINELLKTQETLLVLINKGVEKTFTPSPGQQIIYSIRDPKAALKNELEGTIDGVLQKIKISKIIKTPQIKGKSFGNKGQIIEGILGAAIFARLTARPNNNITSGDVYKIVSLLTKNKNETTTTLTQIVEGDEHIADKFVLKVRLKQLSMQTFLDVEVLKSVLSNQVEGIVKYVNQSVPRYAKHFEKNQKFDHVDIIADGVSMEAFSKVDVILKINDKDTKHFVLSVKEGTTKIIGQRGSGGSRAGRDKQFEILESVWQEFGVSINSIKNTFLGSQTLETAYEVAYKEAAGNLSNQLNTNYKQAVQNIINGTISFGALNTPHMRLVQFSNKDYYVLNLKRLSKLIEQEEIVLDCKYVSGKTRPEILIYDKNSNMPFLTFRMFRTSEGYIRNYIEKEQLLVHLTKIREG